MSTWYQFVMQDVMAEFYDGPHATPAPADAGPVFLGIKNITDDGALDLTSVRHIAEEDFGQWTRRVTPRPNDLVFTYEATLHRYALIPVGFRGCLGRRLALIRTREDVVLPRFLHFAMLGPAWRKTVSDRIISGSTVDRISLVDFPSFPITLPDVATQRSVLSVLGAIDDLIENNRRRVEVLEEMLQAIYREWFVRLRYPSHDFNDRVESALGLIPADWTVERASDALEVNPRVVLSASTEHPFMTMGDLDERSMLCSPSQQRMRASGAKYRNGDTLFARITPCLENGKTGYVQGLADGQAGCGSTEFVVLRGRLVGPAFTYLLARTEDFRRHAIASMSGTSGRQRVRIECFDSFLVAVPPRGICRAFEDSVMPLFALCHTLNQESDRLAALRDLLLPRLVSGEIDVSSINLDELVAAG